MPRCCGKSCGGPRVWCSTLPPTARSNSEPTTRLSPIPAATPTHVGTQFGPTCSGSWPSISRRRQQMQKQARDLDDEAADEADWRHTVMNDKARGQRKRKRKSNHEQTHERATDPFVQVPLWWIELAAKDARSPATLVLIELLRAAWKAKSSTFPLPDGRLKVLGVNRETKRRVLRNLERRPLLTVERSPRKTPIITLVGL